MNTETRKLILPDEMKEIMKHMDPEDRKHIKPMKLDPTPRQLKTGKIGRNDICPCGSGKKFKKCCLK